jgi:hypothetical protein
MGWRGKLNDGRYEMWERMALTRLTRPHNVISITCLTAVLVLASAPASKAQPYRDCPPGTSPNAKTVTETWHGAPLDRKIHLNPKDVWFKLPLGYINPWPNREAERLLRQRTPQNPQVPGLAQATGVSFAFWMPSLRWPERDRLSVPSYRPCEDGRTISASEFIVEAEIEWPWLPEPEAQGFVTPEMRYGNQVRHLGLLAAGQEFGLARLVRSGRAGPIFYSNTQNAKPQLSLRCSSDVDSPPPNPSCDGNVWWPDENLGLRVNFSKQDLPHWRQIVSAARELAYRWRKNALSE